MPDPEDLEEMFEHMDDPQELNFDNDDYDYESDDDVVCGRSGAARRCGGR